MTSTPTRVLGGRYALQHQIGQGGMGAVWLAVDEVLGRQVAVKRIGEFPGGDTPGLVRAQREAKLAARLNHPHVVAVFDFVTEGDEQWLVMEHVEGNDLAALVMDYGPLPPIDAAGVLGQVAEALAAAHAAGIVHRDVKPSNILITRDGTAKLADFGIARARDSTLTASGMVTGSPAYLAPEVAAGQPATEASDVWSLGATLYQTLTGQAPYDSSDNVLSTMYRIVHDPPPRLPGAGWPADLLETTMTTEPRARWPMKRVRDYLRTVPQVASEESASTLLLRPADPAPDPDEHRRTPVLLALLGVAFLLAAAVFGWVVLRADDEPTAQDRQSGNGSTEGSRSPSGSGSPTRTTSSSAPQSPKPRTTPSGTPTQQTPPSAAPVSQRTAMQGFVERYIAAALADPTRSWDMLSPRFQEDCCDSDVGNYAGYWNTIADATLGNVVADPDSMQVSYVITWVPEGERPPEDEAVTLGLVRQGGRYLIDYEL